MQCADARKHSRASTAINNLQAYFVNIYNSANQLTPPSILVLFIVSVLASVYALFTLFRIASVRRNGFFVGFLDLCFMGAFIAGVYELRGIAGQNCVTTNGGFTTTTGSNSITFSYSDFDITADKVCSMLKACFALGIIQCIIFPITALIAWSMHHRGEVTEKEVYRSRSRSHGSRRGHSRRRSSSQTRRHYYV